MLERKMCRRLRCAAVAPPDRAQQHRRAGGEAAATAQGKQQDPKRRPLPAESHVVGSRTSF